MRRGAKLFWFEDWLGDRILSNEVPYVEYGDMELTVRDVWYNGNPNMELIRTPMPKALQTEISNMHIICHDNIEDSLVWGHSKSGIYTLKRRLHLACP